MDQTQNQIQNQTQAQNPAQDNQVQNTNQQQVSKPEAKSENSEDAIFSHIDFGPLQKYLDNDDITDISYSNGGQVWLKSLEKGVYRIDEPAINNALMEKIAFQCSNAMGKTFNMAQPFLDAEGTELRLNFVHESIARNGIAAVLRKTPAKVRLNKDKLINEHYVTENIHDFLIECVLGHCNIIVSGETGSGKTEFVKYLAAHTRENEKIITIEDTLELHLDRIFPHRDIVAMKTNNIASYTEVLVTCMRQNPIWILLSEVRSAEAVMAVRNSISSGHKILSTIHADKATSIPTRLYSLLESNIDIEQFLSTIHRYIQLGVHIRGYFSKQYGRFQREIVEIAEFFVDENNKPGSNVIYQKTVDGRITRRNPSKYLIDYLDIQGVQLSKKVMVEKEGEQEDDSLDKANQEMDRMQQITGQVSVEDNKDNNQVEQPVNVQTPQNQIQNNQNMNNNMVNNNFNNMQNLNNTMFTNNNNNFNTNNMMNQQMYKQPMNNQFMNNNIMNNNMNMQMPSIQPQTNNTTNQIVQGMQSNNMNNMQNNNVNLQQDMNNFQDSNDDAEEILM